ncbi:MAG: hypothetical protein QM703_15730 [Gemmatales bacterium]
MPGQKLGYPQINPGSSQQCQVGMPQSMEVGVLRALAAFHDVGNAHGFEIAADHLSARLIHDVPQTGLLRGL